MTRIYVPRDSSALALGADALATAIVDEAKVRGIDIELVRNGSRGLLYLEPLVEIETSAGRIGYANVEVEDVASLFDASFIEGKATHAKHVGIVDEIPYLKKQQRLTFARIGITDPLSTDDYIANGGIVGLYNALAMSGDAAVDALIESGLRGRGGAAFPAGIKWRTVRAAKANQKYIVCNADEGDSGTFSDRLVMESDPFDGWPYLRAQRISAFDRHARSRDRQGARRRLARRQRARLAASLRAVRREGRGRVCVRRGNGAARIARRQARHRAREAAAACTRRPVRQADGDQQRDHARDCTDHLREGRGVL
jgi:hypothetical protein